MKPKLPSRKSMVKRLDTAFSIIIRRRDRDRCVTCGSMSQIQCGHVFSRSSYGTRWDDRNAFAQCAGCNLKHEYQPYPLFRHALTVHGQEVMDELQLRWNRPATISNPTMRDMVAAFEAAARLPASPSTLTLASLRLP